MQYCNDTDVLYNKLRGGGMKLALESTSNRPMRLMPVCTPLLLLISQWLKYHHQAIKPEIAMTIIRVTGSPIVWSHLSRESVKRPYCSTKINKIITAW